MKRPCGRLPQKKKAVPSSTLSRWVAVFASLFVLVGLSGCANRAPTSVDKEDGGKTQPKTEFLSLGYRDQYEIAAQNSALELLIDPSTMAIAVYAKDSGQLWTSNPSPDSYPEVVDEITINKLNSQVVLQYYNGQRAEELISYSDSVTKEQAEIYAIPNGLRVEYTIGGRESVDLYPQALTAQYVDEVLLPNLDDVQRERFLLYFDKYVYADTVDSLREELSATYKNFSQTDMYVKSNVPLPVRFQDEFRTALIKAGVTYDVLVEQYEKLGYTHEFTYTPSFFVPVEYTLHEDSLEVRVPFSEVTYDEDRFPLTYVELLPYFGSVGRRSDGYMLVPDGCGILVDLDNSSKDMQAIPVYGRDLNQEYENISSENTEIAALPVYGLKAGEAAFFTVINSGSAMADILVSTASGSSTLNQVYTRYGVRPRQSFEPGGLVLGAEFAQYALDRYRQDVVQSYYFLTGEDAGYEKMAEIYRGLLFGEAAPTVSPQSLYIESVGVVNRQESVLGFSIRSNKAFTTIDQLQEIVTDLQNNGVGSVSVRYRNWFGDPLFGTPYTGLKPHSALGSLEQMTALREVLEQGQGHLYLDYAPLYTQKTFPDISLRRDSAVSIRDTYLQVYNSDADEESGRYALNLPKISSLLQSITDTLKQNSWDSVSLNGVGNDLYSDFGAENFLLREDMMRGLAQSVSGVSEAVDNVMIDGANAYLLPEADVLWNVAQDGSRYSIQDRTVPFLQMVLHGTLPYTLTPINQYYDSRLQFLKTIEYGGALSFQLNYGNADILKDSGYQDLFGTKYELNKDQVLAMYQDYISVMEEVQTQRIVGHEQLTEDVAVTRYSNGTQIAVNYSDDEYVWGTVTVSAKNFAVQRNAPGGGNP